MEEGTGKRPGGLTALAVFNFIGAGMDWLGVLGAVVLLVMLSNLPEDEDAGACGCEAASAESPGDDQAGDDAGDGTDEDVDEALRESKTAIEEMGVGVFVAMQCASAVLGVLLLLSGIGYLKQKRILGRGVGNAYAICSLAVTATTIAVAPEDSPVAGFTVGTILAVIWPLLTLLLINTTFKDDLVR